MTTALGQLAEKLPTEFGGSIGVNRFAFQADWTLCHLLELHQAGKDFLVICDYHDDVVVLNASTNATAAEFVQIKTSEKLCWTTKRLIERKKGKDGKPLLSPMGKLYKNVIEFPTLSCSLNFVSNQVFEIKLSAEPESDKRQKFTCAEFEPTELKKLQTALQSEHSLPLLPSLGGECRFEVTALHLKDHSTHAMGKLAEFVNHTFTGANEIPWPISAMYKTFKGEVDKRQAYELPCLTESELEARKGISRESFTHWLNEVVEISRARLETGTFDRLNAELMHSAMPFMARTQVVGCLRKFLSEKLDPGRADLKLLTSESQKFLQSLDSASSMNLLDVITGGRDHLRALEVADTFSDEYLLAIVAWEALRYGGDAQAVTKKLAEEGS